MAPKKPPVPVTLLNPDTADLMKKEKGYWIEVQVPQRKLVLAKGDHILKTYPVAVGMPSYPSPIGRRAFNRVVWNPWWTPPKGSDWVEDPTPVPPRDAKNPLGEIKLPLGKSYLIHGTRVIHSIGQWASHGCVRMLFEDLFGLVQLLMTEYSDASAIEAMEKANSNPQAEFESRLNREVPVVFNYDLVKIYDGYVLIAPDLYNRQGNLAGTVAERIKPHLSKKMIPNPKKIAALLKAFKNQTVMVPMETLAKSIEGGTGPAGGSATGE
ncbi:MAG: L,D-transpeptidase [Deltaproteobacteria bacterium]|nr:L,D-transpeptidase [Deltaproteobacteria bacterium]